MGLLDFEFYVTLIFFLVVFYSLRTSSQQKNLTLAASVAFYVHFSPIFALLMLLTIGVDFVIGRRIYVKSSRSWLAVSVLVNLVPLLWFKVINSGVAGFSTSTEIIVPLAISFYTFRSISYVCDVYRGKLTPCDNIRDFALYVSFFPTLLCGPVERAKDFFERWEQKGKARIEDTVFSISLGLAKKLLIADKIAAVTQPVWEQASFASLNIFEALFLCLLMSIRLYCDFSGYSDIARGIGASMGISIPRNFDFPYLARTSSDFWNRQHISMSLWFQDYVFYPSLHNLSYLGGGAIYVAITVTFIASGLWHGITMGALIFTLLHIVLALLFFHFKSFKDSLASYVVTQLICAISIFCLLAPNTHTIVWVFEAFLNWKPGWGYGLLAPVLVVILFMIHFAAAGQLAKKVTPEWRMVTAAVLVFAISLLSNERYDFIYYRF